MYFQHLGFLSHYTCDKVTMNLLPFLARDMTQQEKAYILDRQEHEQHNSERKGTDMFHQAPAIV